MTTTHKYSVIIVDDEPQSITTLAGDLKTYGDIEVVKTESSPQKARKSIIKEQPDLLFLDMEMPQITGVELLQSIREDIHSDMHVVFYSVFDKYMIDALRNSAFDFLLKPYKKEELDNIITRLRESRHTSTQNNFEQSLRRMLDENTKFCLQTMTDLLFLRYSEILFFQYNEGCRCWEVMLTTGKRYRLRTNVKSKDILNFSHDFLRVNVSCIINVEYLASIENSSLRCILYPPFEDIEIVASRRYYSKIKDTLEML